MITFVIEKEIKMYRKIFIPTEDNNVVRITFPPEWYGQEVEIRIFPVKTNTNADDVEVV